MITRADIIAEALSWRGTPHVHQASAKGVGADCKGLVAGVARELGMAEGQSAYALMTGYHGVDPRLLKQGLAEVFEPASAMRPGDVLLLKMLGKPQHLAILVGERIVHTYARGPGMVITSRLAAALRLWPLDSVWAWRGVE